MKIKIKIKIQNPKNPKKMCDSSVRLEFEKQ